jgi:hypothetical protein
LSKLISFFLILIQSNKSVGVEAIEGGGGGGGGIESSIGISSCLLLMLSLLSLGNI